MENFVDPHVLIRVEWAHKHLVCLLSILHVVAESAFDFLGRGFAIMLVADPILESIVTTFKNGALEGHLLGLAKEWGRRQEKSGGKPFFD